MGVVLSGPPVDCSLKPAVEKSLASVPMVDRGIRQDFVRRNQA